MARTRLSAVRSAGGAARSTRVMRVMACAGAPASDSDSLLEQFAGQANAQEIRRRR